MPLSSEQKAAIIGQRLQQFEAELFQHELNKATAEALNLPTVEADAAIAQLNTAIGVHEIQLAELQPVIEPVVEPAADA